MIVNLFVIFLILGIGKLFSNGSKLAVDKASNRKKYISTICFILILQSGLRNVAVGDDTYAYSLLFNEVKTTSWSDIFNSIADYYRLGIGKDPGYLIFQKLLQYIIDDYQVYLMIIAIIFFSALGSFIYKNTTRLVDAIIAFVIYSSLFYSFFSITGHRQTIATAATLFGYELIKKRKLIPFLILISLAATIHKSVLIFIPFYFIANIKNTKYFYAAILSFFPIFMIYKNQLAIYFINLSGYKNYEQYEGAGTYTFTVMFLLVAIISLWRSKIILANKSIARHYYNAFIMVLFFLPLTWVNPSMMRVVQYFSIFLLLFVPEILESFATFSKTIKREMIAFFIIALISLTIRANLKTPLQYGFFWEEMRLPSNYFIRD